MVATALKRRRTKVLAVDGSLSSCVAQRPGTALARLSSRRTRQPKDDLEAT
jgi:hypothetical protein